MKRRLCIAGWTLRVHQLILFLIGAIFTVSAAAAPFSAAHESSLKDIRIGEYKDHTRIVFEFDQPIAETEQMIRSNGRMTVIFNAAQPRLVRKIPIERSERLNDVQLWTSGNELSVVLLFDFASYRYDAFRMSDPFRIALDVYPLAAPVAGDLPHSAAMNRPSTSSAILPKAEEPDPGPIVLSDPSNHPESLRTEEQPTIDLGKAIETQNAPAPSIGDTPPSRKQPPAMQATTLESPPDSASPPVEEARQSTTSALQYYLVLALVIITIVILALLVIMLLSRYKWTDENKPMKINEFLQKQDDRIASLDEMIQEQLKRYDEA